MARRGTLVRLGNLWRGFIAIWITDLEKQHPEIAYENALRSLVEKYAVLKKTTAMIAARRDEVASRSRQLAQELAAVTDDLAAAVDSDQNDLALVLIQKKNHCEAELGAIRSELDVALQDADSAKASLLEVQAEIQRLKGEKQSMLARLRSADARVHIQEQLDGLSIDAEVQALGAVREHIHQQIAQADLGDELSRSSLDRRLTDLRAQGGAIQAQRQLADLKSARAAARTANEGIRLLSVEQGKANETVDQKK